MCASVQANAHGLRCYGGGNGKNNCVCVCGSPLMGLSIDTDTKIENDIVRSLEHAEFIDAEFMDERAVNKTVPCVWGMPVLPCAFLVCVCVSVWLCLTSCSAPSSRCLPAPFPYARRAGFGGFVAGTSDATSVLDLGVTSAVELFHFASSIGAQRAKPV